MSHEMHGQQCFDSIRDRIVMQFLIEQYLKIGDAERTSYYRGGLQNVKWCGIQEIDALADDSFHAFEVAKFVERADGAPETVTHRDKALALESY